VPGTKSAWPDLTMHGHSRQIGYLSIIKPSRRRRGIGMTIVRDTEEELAGAARNLHQRRSPPPPLVSVDVYMKNYLAQSPATRRVSQLLAGTQWVMPIHSGGAGVFHPAETSKTDRGISIAAVYSRMRAEMGEAGDAADVGYGRRG